MAAASRAAISYNEISNFQTEDALYLLDHLSIQSKASVLDLGCGTGRLAAILAERVGPEGLVVGVDPDQERIQVAINKAYERVQFIVGDDTSFPEGQYDVVTCTDVLHWIEDKEITLKRVYDNLKPGGKFGFTTSLDGLPSLLQDILRKIGALEKVVSQSYFVSIDRMKEMARAVGFEVTLMDVRERTTTFANIDAYTEFFNTVFHGKYD